MAEQEPKPEEEKKQGTLESIVSGFKGLTKTALTIGAIAAMPYVFSYVDPTHLTSAKIFTYTISTGHATANLMQKKPALEGILKRAAIATPLSYQISNTFTGLNQLETAVAGSYGATAGTAAKVGTWAFAGQPALVTADTILNDGLGEKFRKNWWPSVKNVFKYLALPSAINVGFLYQFGLPVQMAVSAGLSFAYGLVQRLRTGEGSFKNLYESVNSSIGSADKLVSNTFYGLLDGIAYMGKSINDMYKKPPQAGQPS